MTNGFAPPYSVLLRWERKDAAFRRRLGKVFLTSCLTNPSFFCFGILAAMHVNLPCLWGAFSSSFMSCCKQPLPTSSLKLTLTASTHTKTNLSRSKLQPKIQTSAGLSSSRYVAHGGKHIGLSSVFLNLLLPFHLRLIGASYQSSGWNVITPQACWGIRELARNEET